jgi:hypothetical protein
MSFEITKGTTGAILQIRQAEKIRATQRQSAPTQISGWERRRFACA